MRLFRPCFLAGWLYPEAIFRIKTTEKILYLTFDDGPDPVSTPQLLEILKKYNIRAHFFCTGEAAEKHQDLMTQIIAGNHLIGNHGYSHFDGWSTGTVEYINDIIKASVFTSGKIFRPPFGRLTIKQKNRLSNSYTIVFWDLMAYDFDKSFGGKKTLGLLKDKIRPGSIIVLHDTMTSCANTIIEEFIIFALNEGYRFELIDVMG